MLDLVSVDSYERLSALSSSVRTHSYSASGIGRMGSNEFESDLDLSTCNK